MQVLRADRDKSHPRARWGADVGKRARPSVRQSGRNTTLNPSFKVGKTILLLTLVLALAACGTDNADSDTAADVTPFFTATPLPEPTIPPTFAVASDILLTNNYARLDGAISARYPDGWQVDSIGSAERGTLRVGSTRQAQLGRVENTGDLNLSMDWAPVTDFGLEAPNAEFDVAALLQDALAANAIEVDPAAIFTRATPDGRSMAIYVTRDGETTVDYVLLNLGGGVAGLAEVRYIGDFDDVLLDLLDGIRYGGPVYVVQGDILPLEPLYRLPQTEFRRINGARLLRDDTRLLTWADDGSVRVYDMATGEELLLLNDVARVRTVQVSADEQNILTLAEGDPIRRYDISPVLVATPDTVIPTGATLYQAPIGRIQDFVWSPDERYIAGIVINNQNFRVIVWDAETAAVVQTLRGTVGSRIETIVWNNASDRLLVYGNDEQARLFDVVSGERILSPTHTGQIIGAVWRPDDAWLVTLARDDEARIWESATGRLLATLPHVSASPQTAIFNSDFSRMVTLQTDRFARIWDTSTFSDEPGPPIEFQTSPALGGAAFIADDTAILSWSNPAATRAATHIVDATTGETRVLVEGGTLTGAASYSALTERFVTYGDGVADLYDATTGDRLQTMEHPNIRGAILSADGTRAITFGEVGLVQVFDVAGTAE